LQGSPMIYFEEKRVECLFIYLCTCKIWCFHGRDNDECRILGYKNTVRTSQETHYFFSTESSQLMLCKIWGIPGGDYEECQLLRFYAVWLLYNGCFWGT
jgi:hypothetical protein